MQSARECSVGPRRAQERATLAGPAGVFRECAAISIWTTFSKLVWNVTTFVTEPWKSSKNIKEAECVFYTKPKATTSHFNTGRPDCLQDNYTTSKFVAGVGRKSKHLPGLHNKKSNFSLFTFHSRLSPHTVELCKKIKKPQMLRKQHYLLRLLQVSHCIIRRSPQHCSLGGSSHSWEHGRNFGGGARGTCPPTF